MGKIRQTIQKFPVAAGVLLLVTALGSCIKEGLPACEEESFVTIKVVDALTGEDITASGEVESAGLYVFDEQECYRQMIGVTAGQIRQKTPISLKHEKAGKLKISAWGNLHDNQTVTVSDAGSSIDNFRISLIEEASYHRCPDDLFFGFREIAGTSHATTPQEIVIARKNARMYITVRGLPAHASADDYYFTVDKKNNGYDLKGLPVRHPACIRQACIRQENGDFVSTHAFSLIHVSGNEDDRMTVNLYQKNQATKAGDLLIASAVSDTDGNPIAPPAARTTNVLLDLGGNIAVYVETTPWDEIYQWAEW